MVKKKFTSKKKVALLLKLLAIASTTSSASKGMAGGSISSLSGSGSTEQTRRLAAQRARDAQRVAAAQARVEEEARDAQRVAAAQARVEEEARDAQRVAAEQARVEDQAAQQARVEDQAAQQARVEEELRVAEEAAKQAKKYAIVAKYAAQRAKVYARRLSTPRADQQVRIEEEIRVLEQASQQAEEHARVAEEAHQRTSHLDLIISTPQLISWDKSVEQVRENRLRMTSQKIKWANHSAQRAASYARFEAKQARVAQQASVAQRVAAEQARVAQQAVEQQIASDRAFAQRLQDEEARARRMAVAEFDREVLKGIKLAPVPVSSFSAQQVIDVWNGLKEAFVSENFGDYTTLRGDLDRSDYNDNRQLKTLNDLHQRVHEYLGKALGMRDSEGAWLPTEAERPILRNLLSLAFEKLSKTEPNEKAAMVIQLIPGITHCETGQMATLNHLALGITVLEDGTGFEQQLDQALARFKEEAADQAFLPTDEEVRALRGHGARATESIQVQQSWRWKLKDDLGLHQPHETRYGMQRQDIFRGSSERALKKFFTVFTPEKMVNNLQNWVKETPARLGQCASYLVEKGLVDDGYSNLTDFFEVAAVDGYEVPTAFTAEGAEKLLIGIGLLKEGAQPNAR
jgi:hypothetical protein